MTFPAYTVVHQRVGGSVKTHLLDGDGAIDGAAWDFDATIINDGSTANVIVCKIDPATGLKVDERLLDVREVEAGAKADSVTAKQSGSNLVLWIRYHVGDYNTKVIRTVLVGYLHPYGAQGPQLGAAGAFVPGGGATVEVDYARIVREVRQGLQGDFGLIIGNMKSKAAAAVIETLRAGGDDSVYEQLINTSYTGALGALRDWDGGYPNDTALDALAALDGAQAQAEADSDAHSERMDAIKANEVLEGKE